MNLSCTFGYGGNETESVYEGLCAPSKPKYSVSNLNRLSFFPQGQSSYDSGTCYLHIILYLNFVVVEPPLGELAENYIGVIKGELH